MSLAASTCRLSGSPARDLNLASSETPSFTRSFFREKSTLENSLPSILDHSQSPRSSMPSITDCTGMVAVSSGTCT